MTRLLICCVFVVVLNSSPNVCVGMDEPVPVFVRMKDQLFPQGGAYEAYSRKNANTLRRQQRSAVVTTLKEKADRSWTGIQGLVEELGCQDVQQYWIVNGFAARVTPDAIEQLSKHELVEFVYQIPPGVTPLHAIAPRAGLGKSRDNRWQAVASRVLKDWHDDSDEPLDLEGIEIPWNLKRVKAPEAWQQENATGKGIVVALMDSGLMVTPSLQSALWRNDDEQLDGKDDDNNGYADDLFGFDFSTQHPFSLGDGAMMTHGSMCGGIIAGRPNNKAKMITGVAPRSRLMVIRGMGSLLGYQYALENGADVLSMSYMWIRRELGDYRGLYRLAHEHLAAGGVVSVGGAGNFRQNKPKGKQIALPKDIPCVIAAAGIIEDGTQPPFSSAGPVYWNGVRFYDDYGTDSPLRKPDVTGCIGGFPVWGRPNATRQRRAWKVVSQENDTAALLRGPQGNSFSGPHAAGVAALMLSANPDLNVWQVKQLMEETCHDRGEPGWDPDYGHGLLDSLAAAKAARKAHKHPN